MSARAHSLQVILEKNLRTEDDLQPLLQAIRMLRGVIKVIPMETDSTAVMAEFRAKHELGQKILAVIYPLNK